MALRKGASSILRAVQGAAHAQQQQAAFATRFASTATVNGVPVEVGSVVVCLARRDWRSLICTSRPRQMAGVPWPPPLLRRRTKTSHLGAAAAHTCRAHNATHPKK